MNNLKVFGKFLDQPILISKLNKKDEFEEYRQEELNADETEIGELEEEENV